MNVSNRHGALAHCRRAALYRVVAHVTRREDTRHAGLKIIGLAVHVPGLPKRAELAKVGAGDKIPF